MKTQVLLALVGLALSGCISTEGTPRFESMNTEELAAYNRDRPIEQMIVCTEEQRSLSRVRRRRCMTVEQAYGSAAQAEQIGVLNSVPGFQ